MRLLFEEDFGLRQVFDHQRRQQKSGDAADHEHPFPAVAVTHDQQPEQRGEHGTNVITRHHRGGRARGLTFAREFGHQGERGRQAAAQAQPGQEPEQAEREDGIGKGHRDGEDREDDHREDHHLAPAQIIGDGTDGHRADRHADEAGGGHGGGAHVRETEDAALHQDRDDGAQHHEVESVEQHGRPTQRHHPPRLTDTCCPRRLSRHRILPSTDTGRRMSLHTSTCAPGTRSIDRSAHAHPFFHSVALRGCLPAPETVRIVERVARSTGGRGGRGTTSRSAATSVSDPWWAAHAESRPGPCLAGAWP